MSKSKDRLNQASNSTPSSDPQPPQKPPLSPKDRDALLRTSTLSSPIKSLRTIWALSKPYFMTSEEKWKARALLGIVVGMTFGQVYLSVKLSNWSNEFYTTMQDYHEKPSEDLKKKAFDLLLKDFSILAGALVGVGVYKQKLTQKLQLNWRQWMMKEYEQAWLGDKAYYRIQTKGGTADNPDQRIAEDIDGFTNSTLNLGLSFLRSSTSLPSFSYILLNGAGPVWFGGALAYAAGVTYLGHKIGKPMVPLSQDQQRYSADYRYGLIDARNNADSIALMDGEKVAQEIIKTRRDKIIDNTNRLIEKTKQMTAFNLSVDQAATILPYLVMIPKYFSREMTLGKFFQTAGAFNHVRSDLSWFFEAYPSLTVLLSQANRLTGFNASLVEAKQQSRLANGTADPSTLTGVFTEATDILKIHAVPGNAGVSFKDVIIKSPDGKTLIESPDMSFEPGERILIKGPSGCGKTTLLRSMRGLWDFGSGSITVPEKSDVLCLGQDAYLPLTTLKGIATFPKSASDFTDAQVADALRWAGLEDVAGLDSGYDQMNSEKRKDGSDWSSLSGGQKQRIGFARVKLHNPQIIMADESSSALDVAAQAYFYGEMNAMRPDSIIISISHRPEVWAFHNRTLEIQNGKIFPALAANNNNTPDAPTAKLE